MDQHDRNPARSRWARRTVISLLVAAALFGGWYITGVFLGEHLRQATVEAKAICEQLVGQDTCPPSLRMDSKEGVPQDPWGRPYRCRTTENGLAIGSYGADGNPRGSGRHGDVECGPSKTALKSYCACDVSAPDN